MVTVLLGLRFVLELVLFSTPMLVGWSVAANRWFGLGVGLAISVAVAALWGLTLSPKARFAWPLPIRVAIELVLFALASLAWIAVDRDAVGIALTVSELVVLTGLVLLGRPPGWEPRRSDRS